MKVSKTIAPVIGAALLVLSGLSTQALAQVDVNIGLSIPLPPPLVIPAPPALVLIPRTRVYLAPHLDVDLLFYRGWWYRPHGGHWFRARSYQGPWVFIHPPKVPRPLLTLPPDYRQIPPEQQKYPAKKVKAKKDKEPPPPKIRKVKVTKGGQKGGPKGKKDKGPDGGPPGNQGKSQGNHLKSRTNKSN
jgi:hypothetical protein